jgi:esterase/lipase
MLKKRRFKKRPFLIYSILIIVFIFSVSSCAPRVAEVEKEETTIEELEKTEEIEETKEPEETKEVVKTEEETEEITEEKEIPPEGYWEVVFKTDDQVEIEGRIFGIGKNGLILAHMYPADQESWKDFALLLSQKGYRVLTFNFRGYGKSGGEKEISLIYKDVLAAFDFFKKEGVEDIILIGASMGGTAVLKVAAQKDVNGVVSMSGPLNWVQMGLSAEEEIRLIEEPKLFMASEGDSSAKNSANLMYELSGEPKQIEIYPGSEHGTNMFLGENGEQVKQDIITFIEENLPVK